LRCYRLSDRDALERFVEVSETLFAVTTMAKGLVPGSHPLAIGCIERALRKRQRAFLAEADLIIGIGYDPVEVEYEGWIGRTPLLYLDIEPWEADPTVRIAGEAAGEIGATLRALTVPAPRNRPPGRRPRRRLARPHSGEAGAERAASMW